MNAVELSYSRPVDEFVSESLETELGQLLDQEILENKIFKGPARFNLVALQETLKSSGQSVAGFARAVNALRTDYPENEAGMQAVINSIDVLLDCEGTLPKGYVKELLRFARTTASIEGYRFKDDFPVIKELNARCYENDGQAFDLARAARVADSIRFTHGADYLRRYLRDLNLTSSDDLAILEPELQKELAVKGDTREKRVARNDMQHTLECARNVRSKLPKGSSSASFSELIETAANLRGSFYHPTVAAYGTSCFPVNIFEDNGLPSKLDQFLINALDREESAIGPSDLRKYDNLLSQVKKSAEEPQQVAAWQRKLKRVLEQSSTLFSAKECFELVEELSTNIQFSTSSDYRSYMNALSIFSQILDQFLETEDKIKNRDDAKTCFTACIHASYDSDGSAWDPELAISLVDDYQALKALAAEKEYKGGVHNALRTWTKNPETDPARRQRAFTQYKKSLGKLIRVPNLHAKVHAYEELLTDTVKATGEWLPTKQQNAFVSTANANYSIGRSRRPIVTYANHVQRTAKIIMDHKEQAVSVQVLNQLDAIGKAGAETAHAHIALVNKIEANASAQNQCQDVMDSIALFSKWIKDNNIPPFKHRAKVASLYYEHLGRLPSMAEQAQIDKLLTLNPRVRVIFDRYMGEHAEAISIQDMKALAKDPRLNRIAAP